MEKKISCLERRLCGHVGKKIELNRREQKRREEKRKRRGGKESVGVKKVGGAIT